MFIELEHACACGSSSPHDSEPKGEARVVARHHEMSRGAARQNPSGVTRQSISNPREKREEQSRAVREQSTLLIQRFSPQEAPETVPIHSGSGGAQGPRTAADD